MRWENVAVLVSRLGVLLALSLLHFVVTYARASATFPSFAIFLYGARLAAVTGVALLVVWSGLLAVETRVARGRLLSTLLALLMVSPLIYYVSAHIAAGDGLRARGLPQTLGIAVGCSGLSVLSALVWSYHFWARRRWLPVLLGLLGVAALLWCEAQLSRPQVQLAALLHMLAIFMAAQLVLLAYDKSSRTLLRASVATCTTVLLLVLSGFVLPERVASARRRAMAFESALAHVETRLFGKARTGPISVPSRARCAALNAKRPVAPLALSEAQRRNVILISIDTLRADHVFQRVANSPVMPSLANFAGEAQYAPRAQTAFPATLLAMTSAFTGFMPSDILLAPKPLKNLFTLTRGRLDTVEAVLPRGRYFTRPDVQAYLLSGAHADAVGSARQQTSHAIWRLRELRAENKRHLMWIHYFEPHGQYEAQGDHDFGDKEHERYQSELAFVDEHLGKLLAFLRRGGWYDDSLIVVFADHGESFGEHDHYFHHYLVYPWLVNVPLLWRAPDSQAGRVEAPVHLMDITPTVLHFLGLPAPVALRGVSLLSGTPDLTRPLFSEEVSMSGRMMLEYRTTPSDSQAELLRRLTRLENGPGYASKLAVRKQDRFLVQRRASLATELYAWPDDTRATHDLAELERERTRELSAEAERFRGSVIERALCDLPAAR